MTKIDPTPTPTRGQRPQGRSERWKQLWQKVKTPLQLLVGQIVGWALRKYLG